MKRVTTILRKAVELRLDERLAGLADPDKFCAVEGCRLKTIEENPFLRSKDDVAQIVGVVDNRVIGGITVLPLEYQLDDKIVTGVTGNWLFVNPEFRSTMYSTRVMAMLPTVYEHGIGTGGAIVDSATEVERVLGYTIWNPVSYHYTRIADDYLRSRLPSVVAKVFAPPLNIALWFQRKLADVYAYLKTSDYGFCQLDKNNEDDLNKVSSFVAQDKHRFKEVHDVRWFKWVLFNNTTKTNIERELVGLTCGGALVGFFMLCFRGNACQIKEWQVPKSAESILPYLFLRVAKMYLKKLNHIAIILDEDAHIKVMNRFGFFKSSCGASSIMVAKGLKADLIEGVRDKANWRTRPAMADASFL